MTKRDPLTIIGRTNWRKQGRLVGIPQASRLQHVYMIGKTGVGKSSLIEWMMLQDIALGRGCGLIDPHGDLAERVKAHAFTWRPYDLVWVDPADKASKARFNPLQVPDDSDARLVASSLLSAFKKHWPDFWGPRLEHVLRNVLLALVETKGATLRDVATLLLDDGRRRDLARGLKNVEVRRFWLDEYEKWPARLRAEAISPLQNKVGAFLADPVSRRFLTGDGEQLDLRGCMDEGKVLIVNLAKGRLGEDATGLLGSLIVSSLGATAFSRLSGPLPPRRFYVYLDEFHSVVTQSLENALSELRKTGLGLTLAHQYLDQLSESLQATVLGNAGSMVFFRLGAQDARRLEAEVAPEFEALDLLRLGRGEALVAILCGGLRSGAFSVAAGRIESVNQAAHCSSES